MFGRVAGCSAAERFVGPTIGVFPDPDLPGTGERPEELQEIRRELGSLLWREAGVVRSGDSLRKGLSAWHAAAERFRHCGPGKKPSLWFETRNMLTVSRLILESALRRPESRGAHFRSDHPFAREQWRGSLELEKAVDGPEPVFFFVRRGDEE